MTDNTPILDRFWAKVEKTDGGCWLWRASVSTAGYGLFSVSSRLVAAHRYAYELLVGPIPEGLELDHLCRVRNCVRPAHLEPVTHAENIRRSPIAATSINARKTHCIRGHQFDEANTYKDPNGSRICRTCRKAKEVRYRDRHSALSW